MKPINAVVLAGDQEDRKILKNQVIDNKAFLNLNGRIMLDYVLECLENTGIFEQIAVIGPAQRLAKHVPPHIKIIPQQGTVVENVVKAAEEVPGWILLCSSDTPLLTPEAVSDFISMCHDAQMFYPLVSKETNDSKYPGVERTYVSLKEGTFTGGNIILVHSEAVPVAAPAALGFVESRKSPMSMARLVGSGTMIKLLTKRLSVAELEEKMSRIFRIKAKAVVSRYPELGIDLDKESDYTYITSKLKELE